MGLKFGSKRIRCTGSFRDRPLVEVRWSVEEGACGLEDLIAGDLGLGPHPPAQRAPSPAAPRPRAADGPARPDHPTREDRPPVVVFAGPAPGNALALRRIAHTARVVPDGPAAPSAPPAPGALDKLV